MTRTEERLLQAKALDIRDEARRGEGHPTKGQCSIEGCHHPKRSRGWCIKHYMRWWKGKDLTATTHFDPVRDRITAGSDSEPEPGARCWRWRGAVDADGYGKLSVNNRTTRAHRASFEAFVAPIPAGSVVDHLCRNPICVNPLHLEAVSVATNNARGLSPSARNARKTHCVRGHRFSDENTHVRPDGRRRCRACTRLRGRGLL